MFQSLKSGANCKIIVRVNIIVGSKLCSITFVCSRKKTKHCKNRTTYICNTFKVLLTHKKTSDLTYHIATSILAQKQALKCNDYTISTKAMNRVK